MPDQPTSTLHQIMRHRRGWAAVLWGAGLLGAAVANSIVALMEMRRGGSRAAWWEPVTWEFSSTVAMLALLPALYAFEHRFPFRVETWRRVLKWHVLAAVVFCLAHVLGMVGLRHIVYWVAGSVYDFGHWPRQLLYEFLKDWRSYITLLLIVYLSRFLMLRVQGEARLLAAPDVGAPVEPIERPDRFLVRKLGTEFLIAAREIEWLEAAENYVNLHVRGRVYPLRSTMTAIQDRLDPQRFVRVHRSHIVNLDFLRHIEPLESGDARLLLNDGIRVACSRRYRAALRRALAAPRRRGVQEPMSSSA